MKECNCSGACSCDDIVVKDTGAQESQNTVKTIPQFLSEAQKSQARDNIGAAKQIDLEAETQARTATDAALKQQIEAVQGIGGFLTAYDFGTPNPTQEELTDYAMSQIPNITDPEQIFNGTRVKNLNNGHVWILTNTPDTEPPIFDWSDNGFAEVGVATQDALGVVKGSLETYKGKINEAGEIEINGLPDKLAEIDTKAQDDLSNTDFLTDCVLSAVNGIYEYSSGRNISIKSGIDILFSNGRKPSRLFKNVRATKQQDSSFVVSGNSGDKITLFLKENDNAVLQALSSKVAKGIKAPTDYEYFKNLNTNLWQKKGAPTIDWTAGFGFAGSLYQWVCTSKVMFAGQLILNLAGRYQSSFPYKVYSTLNGTSYTQIASENWGTLAAANGILFAAAKGITTDLLNFTPVTLPSGFSLGNVYGVGNWFYLFDSGNKLFYKTQDFVSYTQMAYPSANNYYPIGFDVDLSTGNMIVCLAYTQGYNQYVSASQISKDGGETWASIGVLGSAVKIANGIYALGTSTGGLNISSNNGDSWISKVIATSRVRSIEFGGGEWQASITTASIMSSQDNFANLTEKQTGFAVGGAPSLLFGNGLFFMTDFSSAAITGSWTSNSYLAYSQPASQDEIMTITEILTCEIDSYGNIINIVPKWPVDLLNMIDLSSMQAQLDDLKQKVAALS